MQLHDLKPYHTPKEKKPRVGRGGKRGTTSGHGTKGQKSRSGRRMRPAERELLQRLPKMRGIGNTKISVKPLAVNVGDLEKISGGKEITRELLGNAKILGGGELKTPITVKGLPVSASAKKKIEAAGGKVLEK